MQYCATLPIHVRPRANLCENGGLAVTQVNTAACLVFPSDALFVSTRILAGKHCAPQYMFITHGWTDFYITTQLAVQVLDISKK